MKRILFFLLLILPGMVMAKISSMNISDAIKNKIVKLSAVNVAGNYTGRSVRLMVTNIKNDSLNLTIDLGIILKPDSEAFQPMVLAGEENLVLAPKKKGDVDVEVFCGNSPKHCPLQNLHYTFLRVGSDTLISVLRFIHDNRLFDYLGQSGVWAITNHHSLSCVYDNQRDSLSKKLIDVICKVTGREKPNYYTTTAQNTTPGQAAWNPKTLKIIVPFEFILKASAILSVEVYDRRGFMMEQLIDRKRFEKGRHQISVTFDTEPYGAGLYTIKLTDPEKVLAEKTVRAEE